MVVLAGQAPVQHQRAVDLLDYPPLRLRDEAFAVIVRVAADDLDPDVQEGAVDDDLVLEALVHQGLLQTHPAPFGGLVEQGDAGGVVVSGGSQHNDTDDQPYDVDGPPPLAPRDLLVRVQPRRGLRDTRGRTDGLGIEDHEERVLIGGLSPAPGSAGVPGSAGQARPRATARSSRTPPTRSADHEAGNATDSPSGSGKRSR